MQKCARVRTSSRLGRAGLAAIAVSTGAWSAIGQLPAQVFASSGNANLHLAKSVATATMTPQLALSLGVDRSSAIPGDALTYTAKLTNTGATLVVTGSYTAQNTAATTATVLSYFDDIASSTISHCGTSLTNQGNDTAQWQPLAGTAAALGGYTPVVAPPIVGSMTLSVTPIPAGGVTYPSNGDQILGTVLAAGATASWSYTAQLQLTPQQVGTLLNPQVTHVRNTLHAEVGQRTQQGNGQPASVDTDFCQQFQNAAPSGAVNNATITITPQGFGSALVFNASTTPALASVASGASVTVSGTASVPVPAAKGTSETDSAYLARLAGVDGSSLSAVATATANSSGGQVSAPQATSPTTTVHVPIVGISKSGPASADAGTTATYPLALRNTGSASAGALAVLDTVPDGTTGTVSGVPASLAAGGTATAQASYAIPPTQPEGPLTDTASVTWKDANGNTYGPVSATYTTTIVSSLVGATLTLSPSTAGPDVTGTQQSFTAHLVDRNGVPIANQQVSFATTGANSATGASNTDTSGNAQFSYSGSNNGTDTVQATVTQGSLVIQSNTATVGWVTPVATIATTSVLGRFFPGGCGNFCHSPSDTPAFAETFPTIDFNPPAGTVPGNITGVTVNTRPFTDITTDVGGNFTGKVVAQGNGFQAGAGNMFTFDAVFTANYVVAQAGNVTFNFYSDDGFIFGIGNGATRVSGASRNPPAGLVTPFQGYPWMGDFNGPTSPVANSITVHFPAPGSYPYEVDYDECCGGEVALTMATSSTGHGVAPAGNLTITPQTVPTQPVGQAVKLTVAAMDASGLAIANLPVTMTITGANAQDPITATTDANGIAVISYVGNFAGDDHVEVGANVSGMPAISNLVDVPWSYTATGTGGSSSGSSTAPPPSITAPSPADGAVVTRPTPITASFSPPLGQTIASWSVTYQALDPQPPVTLASGTGTPPATLATFDPTVLPNDTYAITVSATASGGGTQSVTSTVAVSGNMKLGRYVTSYQDLSVPVSGYQMQVQRSYDSFDTRSGDFGVGWKVSVANFRTSSNRQLGAGGWTEYPVSCFILCNYQLRTSVQHYVTVTFPDQRQEVFDFTPAGPGLTFLDFNGTAGFTARAGTTSTLAVANSSDQTVVYQFDGNLYASGGGIYSPTRFKLTTRDGRVLILDVNTGLVSETDTSGNTLSVDASGVHSSSGQSITFTRDGAGRITAITGPSGQSLAYSYSSAGDLASFTDADGNTTTYTYDSSHHLLSQTGPGSTPLETLTYDSSGRLVSITDGSGATVNLQSDPGAQTQTFTDPTGMVTLLVYDNAGDVITRSDTADGVTFTRHYTYDSSGHVLTSSDPLGRTSTATYDGSGNLLSITGPTGAVQSFTYNSAGQPLTATDALGNTTRYAYDSAQRITSITDPLGGVSAYAYDAAGNRSQETDARGAVIAYTYDSSGRLVSRTDPAGAAHYGYDASGHLTSVTDPLGATTHMTYDANGNLLTSIDALSHTTQFAYDGFGRMTSKTDPLNRVTSYGYDAVGNLLSVTDPVGGRTSYTYDASGRQLSQTDATGAVSRFTYDGHGRNVSSVDGVGRTTTFAYDAAGEMTSRTMPNGGTYHFTYDGTGRLLTTTDPLGHVSSTAYDAAGDPVSATDALGNTTRHGFDGVGHRTSSTDPLGHTTAYAYDLSGDLTSVTDPLGGATIYGYDGTRRQTTVTDPTGRVSAIGYDADGHQVSSTTPSGHTTLQQYDAAGRLTAVTLPSGIATTNAYDAAGQLTKVTDALGNAATYAYDAAGRRASATDPLGHTTQYGVDGDGRTVSIIDALGGTATKTYDAAGQVTAYTDADGHTTNVGYDALGDMTSVVDPLHHTTSWQYDALGRLVGATNARGQVTTDGYDAGGNLTSRVAPEGTSAFVYDAAGRRSAFSDTTGTTSYTYDNAGRVTAVAAPAGTLGYTYDAAGRRTTTVLPGGRVSTNAYDVDGLLSAITDWNSQTVSYAHDADGRATTVTRPDGVTTTYGYDAAGRLVSEHHDNGSTALAHFDYTLDAAGNRTAVSSAAGTESYGYDAAGRLTAVTYGDGGTGAYGYDAAGNRLTATVGGVITSYAYDAAGQLTSAGAAAVTHDADGNVTGIGTNTFAYDSANRLTSATVGGVQSTSTYDADGVRVASATGASTSPYLVDRLDGLPQIVDDGSSAYVRGADGSVVAQEPAAGGTTYPLSDALGSVRRIADGSGAVVGSADYDVYGAVRTSSGASSLFGFTGAASAGGGMLQLGARTYDPATGGFLSRDSLLDSGGGTLGFNRYAYAADDPTNMVDPSGHEAIAEYGTLFRFALFATAALAFSVVIRADLQCLLDQRTCPRFPNPFDNGNSDTGTGTAEPPTGTGVNISPADLAKLINLAKTAVQACVASGALSAVTGLLPGNPCNRLPSNVFLTGSLVYEATLHDSLAIADGYPQVLTRGVPFPKSWYRNLPPCKANDAKASGKDCDEYPYGSTVQGGPAGANNGGRQADLMLVNSVQNQLQGSLLFTTLYSRCPGMTVDGPNAQFVVLPQVTPVTTGVCKGGA
jgi:RHS repeat-associated protein/uncharacterized repeat protein (TIGR01451 family)